MPSDPYIGDPNSVAIMSRIDAMKPAMRALVHEFGFVIVAKSLDLAGRSVNADALRSDLETWRERRQEEWLRTDYMRKA